MLTGHCVHPYECNKWKKVCCKCPYPKRTIRTKRDASFLNQWRKKRIYQKSKLHISAPSNWLRRMAEQSILNKGAIEFRTIPNGIDEKIFYPGCKTTAKAKLGLCKTKKIILFAGSAATKNPAKGWDNLLKVLNYAKDKKNFPESIIIILGDTFQDKIYGNITLKSIDWVSSEIKLVNYYRASDLYLHLANAENFPLSILEAMHCGIPVVASNVGGIPEQIIQEKTGYALNKNDQIAIFNAIYRILTEKKFHESLATASLIHAQNYFGQDLMTKSYLKWFEKILKTPRSENA
jgi:glycosyltransferase involved in cell wall biosynthesis